MFDCVTPAKLLYIKDFNLHKIMMLFLLRISASHHQVPRSDYQRKITLEFDKKGNKLFSYEDRIRTDSRNVVYVLDCLNDDDNGRVVAVNRNGRLRFTYNGMKIVGTFKPQGIAIMPGDNIVVADPCNDTLHVMNSKGDLLELQFIFKDLGIIRPYSLCFDTVGYLLIGCVHGENKNHGKIHFVKMAERLM
ncbi:unnamed protein product [Mytilus coruscus]|uniref:TRIM71 n=1 Tax=Mytilus coruscus TaxID=42192 RepID=A0A6J8ERV6_MYTCO|nr:unnamed protein product [Mytilus coruscus]